MKTVEQMLVDGGYGHRRYPGSLSTGRHEIFDLDTLEVVARYQAVEAAAFAEAVLGSRATKLSQYTFEFDGVPA